MRPTRTTLFRASTTARWPYVGGGPSACRSDCKSPPKATAITSPSSTPAGLPGLGWYGGEKAYLRGRREPDRLTLRGEGRRYDIAENLAWYMDENGDKLTWLTKVDRRAARLGEPAPAGRSSSLTASRPINSPTRT